ncbi:MAG: TetR/AcrR family transcriptional regulator [Oscillospiraceae bacterium]|nr:TetR/AcrR family transcriptional regulator [Oscillospiraceae bacterium]
MSLFTSKNTEAIVNTALELFKSKGYVNVSVSDICRAASVPRSSFYSIFAGKEDIITYLLRNLKDDYQSVFSEFLNAKNDLDRIWLLYDRYLTLAMEFGPDLTGTLFSLELQKPVGVFEFFDAFNEWFVKLIRNCQEAGLIRNKNRPEDIVVLGVRIAVGAAYEWCLTGGGFDLREVALAEHEILYDVPPEYRHKTDKG